MNEREWVEVSELPDDFGNASSRAATVAELTEKARSLRFQAKKEKSGGYIKSSRELKRAAQALEKQARGIRHEGMAESLRRALSASEGDENEH